ncbi:MAG: hypothetical protein HY903_22980 [Deltaproteobacteria bacterium]|nr:hypothetical protein [Deltaproteobacteria bacterium]
MPRLSPKAHVFQLEPHARYRLEYATAPEPSPPGTEWTGDALDGSPLAYMMRRPLILKADDFGSPFGDIDVAFIDAVDAADGVVALGIVTALIAEDDATRTAYRALNAGGFELWFHGHTHTLGDVAEFSGSGLASQMDSFARGITAGRERLGVEFHSFGAPGNGFDADTMTALTTFPQLVVWFFGAAEAPVFVLPRLIDLESKVGVVRDVEEFSGLVEQTLAANPTAPITLQLHPRMWTHADLDRARTAIASLYDRGLRPAAPFELWAWRQEAARVRLFKETARSYILDLSQVELRLRVTVDPAGPTPVRVTEVD